MEVQGVQGQPVASSWNIFAAVSQAASNLASRVRSVFDQVIAAANPSEPAPRLLQNEAVVQAQGEEDLKAAERVPFNGSVPVSPLAMSGSWEFGSHPGSPLPEPKFHSLDDSISLNKAGA